MTSDTPLHIAYALDDNFLECTCVSATSLLFNTKRDVHFHVLESSLSEKSKSTLRQTAMGAGKIEWSFYHIDKGIAEFSTDKPNLTDETYYRFMLPLVCPHLDKILYIDGDTIINGDISELFDIELGDNFVAAVYEDNPFSLQQKRKELLNIPATRSYFNAGVLLVNLALWRESDFFGRAVECVTGLRAQFEQNNLSWFDDQEVLNYLVGDRMLRLPPKYNMTLYNMDEISLNAYSVSEWKEAILSFLVLHNNGRAKPFIKGRLQLKNPEFELYYKYKNISPVFDPEDHVRVLEYRRREKLLADTLIYNIASYFAVNRQAILQESIQTIKKHIGPRRLVIWGNTRDVRLLTVKFSCANLLVDKIVDGTKQKQGEQIFDYIVEEPSFLDGNNRDYYVVLAMRTSNIAAKIIALLGSYGYTKDDMHYVYEEIYNSSSVH